MALAKRAKTVCDIVVILCLPFGCKVQGGRCHVQSDFQNVIVQLKDATDRILGVMDPEGIVISCSDTSLLGERWPEAALKVG